MRNYTKYFIALIAGLILYFVLKDTKEQMYIFYKENMTMNAPLPKFITVMTTYEKQPYRVVSINEDKPDLFSKYSTGTIKLNSPEEETIDYIITDYEISYYKLGKIIDVYVHPKTSERYIFDYPKQYELIKYMIILQIILFFLGIIIMALRKKNSFIVPFYQYIIRLPLYTLLAGLVIYSNLTIAEYIQTGVLILIRIISIAILISYIAFLFKYSIFIKKAFEKRKQTTITGKETKSRNKETTRSKKRRKKAS